MWVRRLPYPTQLGLMGTFRYTFTVIVCTCFFINPRAHAAGSKNYIQLLY